MKNLPEISELTAIVRDIASRELMPHFGRINRRYKADRSIVTSADIATQQALQEVLAGKWPEYGFLAEEMSAQQQLQALQNTGNGLWIIDPLDGTSNFAAGIPYFAISIALFINGEVHRALVHDPNRDETFSAGIQEAATLNGNAMVLADTPGELRRAIGVVDFKRLPAQLASRLVTSQPFSSQRSFGSVALDWCWLAANRFHVYLHGRSNIWDYAAGELIFRRSGGYSCTLDGESVFRPTVEPRSAVAAGDAGHFREWTAYLGVQPVNGDITG